MLLQEMTNDAGYDDPGLAKLGLGGTRLTGTGDDVAAQPARPCPPVVDQTFIMQSSRFTKPMNMARKANNDPLLDKAVHDTTLEERKKERVAGQQRPFHRSTAS